MSKYIVDFVTGHGINFQVNKRNLEAFSKSSKLWREIGTSLNIDDKSIVMLCGAKNNGKSSLLRYLVNLYNHPDGQPKDATGDHDDGLRDIDEDDEGQNSSNNSDRYAYFVDYDPGQPEMTTPGLISAHIVRASSQPLKSPTYLNVHQHEPIMMSSVGSMNVNVDPKIYIDNCRYVFEKVKEHRSEQNRRGPIFINTMGYIRNVGLAVLMDQIKICRPTNLIVLNLESDPMRTVYADLSPSAMDNTRASFYYELNQRSQKKLNYRYEVHDLQFTFVDSTSVTSKNRTALQLAYMASIPDAFYKPIMQANAKWLSLENVSIYCVSSYPLKEGIVLELLHHSWIHLVKIKKSSIQTPHDQSSVQQQTTSSTTDTIDQVESNETSNQFTICKLIDNVSENKLFGCGIVADIDLEKRRLAIITPVEQEVLDNHVDCIIKPLSIQVPREMIQDGL